MARSTFPTSASRTISQWWVQPAASHLLSRSPSSAGGTHWSTDRASHRGAPFTRRRSSCSKPSPIRRSSPSRTYGCSKNLRKRLEQQTATSEILGVIASSPTDIQPVLDTVVENAARLCEATDAHYSSIDGDVTAAGSLLWLNVPDEIGTIRYTDSHAGSGELLSSGKQFTSMTSRRSRSEFPEQQSSQQRRQSHYTCYAVAARRHSDRSDCDSPHGGSSVYGKADRSTQNLRRSSRHRHRERAVVQRIPGAQRGIARGAGASDGDVRGARHHQPLADGRAAGARRHRRERRAGLWDR